MKQENSGLFWPIVIVAFAGTFVFIFLDGTRFSCDEPPLRDGAAVVIGKPCSEQVETQPEREVIIRPLITLEAVKFLALLIFPVALIIVGGVGVYLALRARYGI